MRRRHWSALIAALALSLPVLVIAQDEGEFGGEEEAATAESSAAPAESSEGLGNAPTEYTVQDGDTLWDLCRRFLNNPWYWPKIWSYNPEIENPHWIYPGNRIRFYPGAGALPAQVESIDEPEQLADTDDMGDDLESPDQISEADLFDAPSDLPERLARIRSSERLKPRKRSFVTREELKKAGIIDGSMEDTRLLTLYQKVYIKLESSAQPGQQFELFRVTREIRHPITGSDLGYVTVVLGTASIDRVDGKMGIATIDAAYDVIERGDRVGPISETGEQRVREVPNEKKLKGYIVETAIPDMSMTGEYYVVYLDLGSKDGVKLGNTFMVLRAGDGFTGETDDMPDEVIGKLVVMEVRDEVSTAVVTKSNREMYPGDRIEMRVAQ